MAKATNAIVRGFDPKSDIIRYHMQDKRKNLPKYKEVVIDGTHVRLILEDGSVFHLPSCFVGYELKTAFPHEITLIKK